MTVYQVDSWISHHIFLLMSTPGTSCMDEVKPWTLVRVLGGRAESVDRASEPNVILSWVFSAEVSRVVGKLFRFTLSLSNNGKKQHIYIL